MRKLSISAAAFAAESLAIAHSHFNTAEVLVEKGDSAAAVARLYYAALFTAKAALADLGRVSKKHNYWAGQFNQRFGKGTSWVPVRYVSLLNELQILREAHDYGGSVPSDTPFAKKKLQAVSDFLTKLHKNTPLVHYPEFIADFVIAHPHLLALEFDFYCPRSYLNEEHIQFQVRAARAGPRFLNRVLNSAKSAVKALSVSRKEDYVLGWNSRLGQRGDGYLIFLDIDESDEGAVKQALAGRPGWLFKSGRGYHFIGKRILPSDKEWRRRLNEAARSKKLKDLIDKEHVEISLHRGYSTLRVTNSPIKKFRPFLCWDNT